MATVKEIRDQIDTYDSVERESILGALFAQLSTPSRGELLEFQRNWDPSRTFAEFVHEQNKIFRTCIELECSDFGRAVREVCGLSPLTLDTTIEG